MFCRFLLSPLLRLITGSDIVSGRNSGAINFWISRPVLKKRSSLGVALAALPLLGLAACGGSSTPAPEPVLLSQFNAKTDRFGVVSTVGKPEGTIVREGRSCDIYKIYTTGLTAGGRAAMKAGEVLTSVATLGLAQIVWAPVKAGTRPQQHTTLFCFGKDDKLVDLYDKDPTDSGPPDHIILNKTAYATPVNAPPAPENAITQPASPAVIAVDGSSTGAGATGLPVPATVPSAPVTTVAEQEGVSAVTTPGKAESAIDHTAFDAATGQKTIYLKQATPEAAAGAGSIGLNNVSREAVAGTTRVKTGDVIIPANATADDLNTLSGRKSSQANRAALGNPAAPSSASTAQALSENPAL